MGNGREGGGALQDAHRARERSAPRAPAGGSRARGAGAWRRDAGGVGVGFNPVFNNGRGECFLFEISDPESAILRITVPPVPAPRACQQAWPGSLSGAGSATGHGRGRGAG